MKIRRWTKDESGVFNLTGGMASLDGPALNGAKLALKQVNVKQAREAGIMLPIMGGDAYDSPLLVQLAGPKNAENVYFSDSVGLAAKSGMTDAFVKA